MATVLSSPVISAPKLNTLPAELVLIVCGKLHSLVDLYALMRASRRLHRICSTSKARLRPRFQHADGRYLFPPHPYLLLSALAPRITDWAVESKANMSMLRTTMKGGGESLLYLATQVSKLTLEDARRVHATKANLLEPIARFIERGSERGPAMLYAFPPCFTYFYRVTGSLSTVYNNAEECVLSYVAYCAFMHREVDAVQRLGSVPQDGTYLYKEAGRDFLKYCTSRRYNWVESHDLDILPIPHREPVTSVILDQELMWGSEPFFRLDRILSIFWDVGELTPAVDYQFPPTYGYTRASPIELLSIDPRLWIFFRVVLHLGWWTFQLFTPTHLEWARPRLESIKRAVLALSDEQVTRASDCFIKGGSWMDLITDLGRDGTMYRRRRML